MGRTCCSEEMTTGVMLVTYTFPWFLESIRTSCFTTSFFAVLSRSHRVSLYISMKEASILYCRKYIHCTCNVIKYPKWWKHYNQLTSMPSHYLRSWKKVRIQLGFEPRTFWLLVRHSYHWATGPLVAEECRIDVNILRIEFNPDSDLATQARHTQHAKHVTLNSALCTKHTLYG